MIDCVNPFCIKNVCSHVASSPTGTKISLLTAMIELHHPLTGEGIQEGSSSAKVVGQLGIGHVFRTTALSRVERSQHLDRLIKFWWK